MLAKTTNSLVYNLFYISLTPDILKQRTTNEDLKKHAIALMEESGSFTYTLEVLDKLTTEINTRINELGGNKILERRWLSCITDKFRYDGNPQKK